MKHALSSGRGSLTASVPRLAAVALVSAAALACAATAGERSRGEACAAIDEATARLACFDAAFPRRASGEPPHQPAAPVETAVPDTAADTRKFGLSSEQIARLESRSPEPQVSATTAVVTSVRRLPTGYLQVTLDNEQVWQQTETDSQVWLRISDRVTIRRGKLGSFLLETPSRYSTHVRRIK